MFRQIVMHRWVPDTSDDAKCGFREAMEGLREVPEVVGLRCGDDAAHFDGNHHFVSVIDFPDFEAARRYVASPPHQRFVTDHAKLVATDRVVVQHDWGQGRAVGLHHAKMPVTDVARSRDWYVKAFGFVVDGEFREDGELRGVSMRLPDGDFTLALRGDPERARALRGFDAVCLAVGTRGDLDQLLLRLDDLDVAHSEPFSGRNGDAADVPDPDGLVVRLHTLG